MRERIRAERLIFGRRQVWAGFYFYAIFRFVNVEESTEECFVMEKRRPVDVVGINGAIKREKGFES